MTGLTDTNSGTRRFYRDPLAANWMRKHYGMKFKKWDANDPDDAPFVFGPWFIHSDSLHLLDPQDGDIVGGIDSDGFTAAVVSIRRGMLSMETNIVWAGSEEYRCYQGEKIIQRNGIPFIWPESEAA